MSCVSDLWDIPRGDVQEAACTRHLELQEGVDHRGTRSCRYVDRRIYALWGWGGELGEMGPGAPVRSTHIEGMEIKGGTEQDRRGRLQGGRETALQERAEEGAEKKLPLAMRSRWSLRSLQSLRGGGLKVEAIFQRLHPPVTLGSHPPPSSILLPPTSFQKQR